MIDFANFLQADLSGSLFFTCKKSSSSGQYVSHESVFWFTQQQCGYHGNQWPKPIFATPLRLPTKFGARRSINSWEEGCENFPMFYWWNMARNHVFRVSMATHCIFPDASIFPVTFGPLLTLSRKPRRNRTKTEEKLKIPTSEFYIRDIAKVKRYLSFILASYIIHYQNMRIKSLHMHSITG